MQQLMILDTQQTTVTTMTVAEWVNHHIEHLTGVEKGSVKKYQAYLRNDIELTARIAHALGITA